MILIEEMLESDFEKRMTLDKINHHPYFENENIFLTKAYEYEKMDPEIHIDNDISENTDELKVEQKILEKYNTIKQDGPFLKTDKNSEFSQNWPNERAQTEGEDVQPSANNRIRKECNSIENIIQHHKMKVNEFFYLNQTNPNHVLFKQSDPSICDSKRNDIGTKGQLTPLTTFQSQPQGTAQSKTKRNSISGNWLPFTNPY